MLSVSAFRGFRRFGFLKFGLHLDFFTYLDVCFLFFSFCEDSFIGLECYLFRFIFLFIPVAENRVKNCRCVKLPKAIVGKVDSSCP